MPRPHGLCGKGRGCQRSLAHFDDCGLRLLDGRNADLQALPVRAVPGTTVALRAADGLPRRHRSPGAYRAHQAHTPHGDALRRDDLGPGLAGQEAAARCGVAGENESWWREGSGTDSADWRIAGRALIKRKPAVFRPGCCQNCRQSPKSGLQQIACLKAELAMAPLTGLEPATPGLGNRCSIL